MPSQSWYGWRAAPGRAGDDDGVIGGDENNAPLTPAQIETIKPMLEQMDKIKPGTRTTPLRQVSATAWKKLLARLPPATVQAAKDAVGSRRPARRALARKILSLLQPRRGDSSDGGGRPAAVEGGGERGAAQGAGDDAADSTSTSGAGGSRSGDGGAPSGSTSPPSAAPSDGSPHVFDGRFNLGCFHCKAVFPFRAVTSPCIPIGTRLCWSCGGHVIQGLRKWFPKGTDEQMMASCKAVLGDEKSRSEIIAVGIKAHMESFTAGGTDRDKQGGTVDVDLSKGGGGRRPGGGNDGDTLPNVGDRRPAPGGLRRLQASMVDIAKSFGKLSLRSPPRPGAPPAACTSVHIGNADSNEEGNTDYSKVPTSLKKWMAPRLAPDTSVGGAPLPTSGRAADQHLWTKGSVPPVALFEQFHEDRQQYARCEELYDLLKYGEPETLYGEETRPGGKAGARARRRRYVLEFICVCQSLSSKAFARGHFEAGMQYQQRAASFTQDERERSRLTDIYGHDLMESIDEKLRTTRSVDSRMDARESALRQKMLMAAETARVKRKRSLFPDSTAPAPPSAATPSRRSAKSRQRAARRKRQRLAQQQTSAPAASSATSTTSSKPRPKPTKPNPKHANLTCHKCGKVGHIAPNCPGK